MKQRNSKNELKEKTDLLKEYISMIPVGYTFDNETAKKVFAVLYYYSVENKHQPFTIGQRTIADIAMMSQMTVSRYMSVLIDKYRYVECKKGHLTVNSTYQILPPVSETSPETFTETFDKNDMFQKTSMFQQNVSTKMIDNVSANTIDNEGVTDKHNTETFTETFGVKQNTPMFHNLNNNLNLKHKLNIPNSNNSNKHKILNNDMEKENKEKVNVTLNSKEAINEIAVAIAENIVEYLDKNWKEKVTQLEEVVNKQNETISLLTSRLDKASKFCADMHKQLSSQSNLSKDSNSGIADSRPYVNLSIEDKNNLYEYNKAIQEFYDLKDLDIAKAEEKLHILNTLYDKLPQEKQLKISRAREVFEDKKKKNSQPHISDFRPLQSKFYATLNEGASLERDEKLIETFNAINAIGSKDNENNVEKIRQAFAKALQNEEGLRKVYRCRLITFEKLWSNAVALKEDEKAFEYAEAYIQEYLSYESQPECVRIALGMKRKIEILKLDVKRGENTLHSPIFDYYHKNRPLSPQNTEDNKDIHQEKEKPSDGLKTTKNEVSKDMPADVEVIEEFKGPDEETLKQIYEQYAVAN